MKYAMERSYREAMMADIPTLRENASYAIPDELARFLKGESYSILIKGGPGTGKTTLATTILRALEVHSNFLYLCTRSSPAQLFKSHGWLGETFGVGPASKLGAKGYPPSFVDARLDEPSQLFERITGELMDVRSPVIVIDAWNALEDTLESDELQTNMKVLQTWRDRVSAKLILVGETSAESSIDALVDGLVELTQKEVENRRLREILVSKLVGVRISNPLHYFTLNGGSFRSFRHLPAAPDAWGSGVRLKPWKDKQTKWIPSGYPELDLALGGGFPAGSVISLHLAPEVDPRMALAFLGPLLGEFTASHGRVLLLPPEGLEKSSLDRFLEAWVPRSGLKRVLRPGPGGPGERGGFDSYLEWARAARGEPLLGVLAAGRGAVAEELESLVEAIGAGAGLAVVVTRGGMKPPGWVPSATKLTMLNMNGTLFVRPDAPFAQFFAVAAGRAGLELEPMV